SFSPLVSYIVNHGTLPPGNTNNHQTCRPHKREPPTRSLCRTRLRRRPTCPATPAPCASTPSARWTPPRSHHAGGPRTPVTPPARATKPRAPPRAAKGAPPPAPRGGGGVPATNKGGRPPPRRPSWRTTTGRPHRTRLADGSR